MGKDAQLMLLQADLGLMRISASQQQFFTALLAQSAAELQRKGIRLQNDAPEDDTLIASLAAWKYRVRTQAASPAMPEMIRSAIRDRQLHQVTVPEVQDG